MEVVKNINWSLISVDGLLDFLISQSKLLINSSDLQEVLISEFSRRFRQEYDIEKLNNNNNSLNNLEMSLKKKNPNLSRESTKSFTSELVLKLISNLNYYNF